MKVALYKILNDEHGLTLLELLVAVAVLALLAVPIAEGIRLGLNAWTRSHEQAQVQEKIALTQERLEQWLSSAQHFDISRRQYQSETMLSGISDTVEFSTALHPDPNLNGLYRARLRLRDQTLEIGFVPDFAPAPSEEEWTWRGLLDEVATFEVGYMKGVDASNEIDWRSQWGGTSETIYLPKAIKMNLTFLDTDLTWQEQVIPLVVEEQAFCSVLSDRTCLAGATAE